MKIHTFRGPSLQDALRQVREKLGPDAAVLHTRRVQEKRRLGFLSQSLVEVEASADLSVSSRFDDSTSEKFKPEAAQAEFSAGETKPSNCPPESMIRACEELGLGEAVIEVLWQECMSGSSGQLGSTGEIIDALRASLRSQVQISGDLKLDSSGANTIAVVGPAGVGKTSAVSKLAHRFSDSGSRKVGIMTIDTMRPGAVDQLLQVAEHLGAELEVVSSLDGVHDAMERLRCCDVVLVDTPGQSTAHQSQLEIVRNCLTAIAPHSTQLVLSAWLSSRVLGKLMHQFGALQPTHLLISKIDEAVDLATWLPTLKQYRLPISYLSTGQSAARDFEVATEHGVADAMLQGEKQVSGLTPPQQT